MADTHSLLPTLVEHTAYHEVHMTETLARSVLWMVLAEYLSVYVPLQGYVIELGAGYCDWINHVRAAAKVAVDLWDNLPYYAASDVRTIQHDLSKGLPTFDQPFDVALASNLLEHLEPDAASHLVADVFTQLRSSGRFIVIQPNFRYAYRSYFDDYTHRSIFTDVSLSNLMRSHGFRIERLEARFMPYSLRNSRLPIRPWLIRAYLRSPLKPFAGQMLVIARKP